MQNKTIPQDISREEIEFNKHLVVLANVCRFALSADAVSIYDTLLSKFGYGRAIIAIQKVIATRKSTDSFPSVSELIDAMTSRSSDRSTAVEISDKVWSAVSKFGAYNEKEAKEWCGELGSKVIERSDWSNLCVQEASKGGFIKAQLRDTAISIIESERHKTINKVLGVDNDGEPTQISDNGIPKELTQKLFQNYPGQGNQRKEKPDKGSS